MKSLTKFWIGTMFTTLIILNTKDSIPLWIPITTYIIGLTLWLTDIIKH